MFVAREGKATECDFNTILIELVLIARIIPRTQLRLNVDFARPRMKLGTRNRVLKLADGIF